MYYNKKWFIKDARGRKDKQADPIALYFLRHNDIIDAETLHKIVNENAVRVSVFERVFLIIGTMGVLLVSGLFIYSIMTKGLHNAPYARTSSLMCYCCMLIMLWFHIKRQRYKHVAGAMLKYKCCPHCGYNLDHIPVDSADGLIVCPECGCAWDIGITRK